MVQISHLEGSSLQRVKCGGKSMSQKEEFKLFNMPWKMFLFISVVVLAATYLGVLPVGMAGCFVFMIVVGTWLDLIGNKTPIIRSYFGGGAIVVLFGVALLHYFHLLPEIVKDADGNVTAAYMQLWKEFDLVGSISTFFKPTGAFLDWYIAALITGSILGMNRKLLIKAAARYFPAIFGGLITAFALCSGVAAIMGYGAVKALLLIALPIMGGGMGAGASPLSKIFDASGTMSAAEALSIMTPAVAIGNALSIVLAGLMVKLISSKSWNGQGQLMQATTVDPKELEISPEVQAKRDKISVTNLGIGLLVSGTFFAFGYICSNVWSMLIPQVTVHAYAFMIITVAIFKIGGFLPEWVEIACYQWFQFIMKNLTNVLLLGIGLCYLDIGQVVESFSITYLILCGVTVTGAFFGAGFVGKFVGFYPVEAGITAGLCMSNMGGTGDVAVLSAADRMELMPFAQISSRLGGAIILLIGSLMLSMMGGML